MKAELFQILIRGWLLPRGLHAGFASFTLVLDYPLGLID